MADEINKGLRKAGISVSTPVLAVIFLIFGVLLLIFPDLVGYLIGIFLIIEGILLLVNYMERRQPPKESGPPPPPPPPPAPTPVEAPTETPPATPATQTAKPQPFNNMPINPHINNKRRQPPT